jgi:transcriptional regulator of arginine metabolism
MSDDLQLKNALMLLTQLPELHDQHALLQRLQAAGFSMTQSTLSRKLKQLGFEKRGGVYKLPGPNARVLHVQQVPPNLLVLKTEPGYAQALAAQLDRTPLPGQAGTVAGDDTVFVATLPEFLAASAEQAIRLYVQGV